MNWEGTDTIPNTNDAIRHSTQLFSRQQFASEESTRIHWINCYRYVWSVNKYHIVHDIYFHSVSSSLLRE